jgi:hypothetical protein
MAKANIELRSAERKIDIPVFCTGIFISFLGVIKLLLTRIYYSGKGVPFGQ